ncbi:MAG: IS110 family transposase [Treponema sp.]|nr:IS110 family transposase [Treponema sp.]
MHVRTEEKIESLDEIKVYPTTEEGYAEFLKRISLYRETGAVVKLAVESTGNTKFFKNQVEKAGAEVTVVNTVKFKVINESVTKTDKHDAATLSEFLKDYKLPECYLCSKETENMRRLIKSRERLVRAQVGQKNEIHALLVSMGMQDETRSLQSKKGRQKVLDALESNNDYVLEAQSVKLMLEIIDTFAEKIKIIEKQLEELTKDDEMVNRLMTIRGCGKITAWIIRAYTEDITRFANSKKYAAFCGLVPKVKDSNDTVHHGSITRHGPVELRTAFVQLFMGMRRCKDTKSWRMMQRYEYMKKNKGSGKSIISGARKTAEIVWALLSYKTDFDAEKMRGIYKPLALTAQVLSAVNI